MKTFQRVVTSGNSPLTIPMNPRGGPSTIGATPSGGGNYTVEFVVTPQQEGLTNNPFPVDDMTAATTAVAKEIGAVEAIIVTLNSGTDVTIEVAQSDV